MTLHDVSLNDKFDLTKDQVFATGTQAIVRMLMMQRALDAKAGLNTAGFVSGYRGSPLGALDQQLSAAKASLSNYDIKFQPGINEELAATAVWGTQQIGFDGRANKDGVFGLWYGKGPGVDRAGDVFRHANLAGSAKHGGVLALMGDDHTAESSTNAHQTEFNFLDCMIPILNPAGVQEMVDYGLYGYALSRFAGTWTAMKCVKDNVESTASIDARLDRLDIVTPEFDFPAGGVHIRPNDLDFLGQETRLHEYKRLAANAFIRANNLNKIVYSGGSKPKLGIISVGKSFLDVRQALDDLDIDENRANQIGLRLFKVAAPWPFDREDMKPFVDGLDMVIVVEEKRSLIETQLRESLYRTAYQPQIIGKKDEREEWLFPVKGALDPNDIAVAVGERIQRVIGPMEDIDAKVKRIRQYQAMLSDMGDIASRTPFFCSGCPHNSSTKVPEGSVAAAGIGCHFMALWMDRDTAGFTQMGGEGAQWVGQAPFSNREHIFQNLGDGTYNHSGSLAIRFAVSAGANVTYKILYNDAVAMTGGQPHEGGLTVDQIARQIRAEGVDRIAVVTDEPYKYGTGYQWPANVSFHDRSEMDSVQRELRDIPGVTALIYDQTCAAEKRRRRKRGTFPDPDKRIFINELVCEGCGDCGVQSNCVAVQPVETEFGRKRRIDQSNCNKDFSCVNGFCPSFVTVHGAEIRTSEGGVTQLDDPLAGVPDVELPSLEKGWASIITGVGGTGVVTIGAILGMAAHLEGKGCGMIDMAGLAQKGGAVFSHVRIANTPEDIHSIRVSAGKADTVLGCDLVVSGSRKVLAGVRPGQTVFVANLAEVMPGEFTRDADYSLPTQRLKKAIVDAAGVENTSFFDATRAANLLFGNAIAANMMMLGLAYQNGGVPLSASAIEQAIALNGQAVEMNVQAFRWGRKAAHDPAFLMEFIKRPEANKPVENFDQIVARRIDFLRAYQDLSYATRFSGRVSRIEKAEETVSGAAGELSERVARNLFKLMAIKDEYEVARLYTDGAFDQRLKRQFKKIDRIELHLAPPVLGRKDKDGNPIKSTFGPWMLKAFRLLAALKPLRGTWIDPFSKTGERKMERQILELYEDDLTVVMDALTADNIVQARAFLDWPRTIRGFGHVKAAAWERAQKNRKSLLAAFLNPQKRTVEAAE